MGAYAGPNIDQSSVISNANLLFTVDAGNVKSYSGSGAAWNDLALGNNLSLIGSPTYSSTNGGCLVFDGTNHYAYIPNGSISSSFKSGYTTFSSIFVAEVFNTDTSWHELYGFGDADNFIDVWYQASTGNFGNDATGHYPSTGTMGNLSPRFNIWAVTQNNSGSGQSKIYRNGVLIDTKSITNTQSSGSYDFCIGAQPDTKGYRANMKVSALYIFKQVLTDTDISNIYNVLKIRYGTP